MSSQNGLNFDANGNLMVSSVFPNSRNRIALVGDSIAEFNLYSNNVPTTVGSFVVLNGIGTLTFAATTFVFTGNYFSLNNVADPTMSLADNGTFVQAISASSPTTASTVITFASKMANGDYSNSFGGAWQVADVCRNTDTGLVAWLNQYLRGQYMITANYACVGEVSTQTLAKIPKVLAGVPFDIALLAADGINDISFLTPAATAFAFVTTVFNNYVSCIQQLQAAGKKVWLQLPCPSNQAAGSGAATNAICFHQLRQLLLAFAQANNQLVVFDTMKEMIAGQSATGGYTTNAVGIFSGDATHPNANAYSVMAANEQGYLVSQTVPTEMSQVSILDDNFSFPAAPFSSANFAQNSGMQGVGGALAGGATGTVANSWNLALQGAATSVVGTGALVPTQLPGSNSQNYGFAQRVQCATSATGQGFKFTSGIFYTNAVFPGWFRFGIRVYVRAATAGLGSLALTYNMGPKNLTFGGNGGFDVGYALPLGTVLWITSGPLFIPSLPAAGQLFLQYVGAGAGSVDLEISAPFIRPIGNPYV